MSHQTLVLLCEFDRGPIYGGPRRASMEASIAPPHARWVPQQTHASSRKNIVVLKCVVWSVTNYHDHCTVALVIH